VPAEPTSVLLARHGQSEWNAGGRWQGHADPPLTELGRRQAEAAAKAVGPVDVVVASDLQRARVTAEILAAALGVGRVVVDARFRERAAGEWTGLTRPEIEERWPGYLADGRRPPGFELDLDIIDRVLVALHDVHARWPGRRALVVAHGGVVRAVERHLDAEEGLLANLGARWLEVHDSWISPGQRVSLVDPHLVTVTEPQQL
jgi:probable phosphoglycerate mutase